MQHAFQDASVLIRRAVLQDVKPAKWQQQCRYVSRNTAINKGIRQLKSRLEDKGQPWTSRGDARQAKRESAERSKTGRVDSSRLSSDLDALMEETGVGDSTSRPIKPGRKYDYSRQERDVNDVWASNASNLQRARSSEVGRSPYSQPREPRQRFQDLPDRSQNRQDPLLDRTERRRRYSEQLFERQDHPEDFSNRRERPYDRSDRRHNRSDRFEPAHTRSNEGPDFSIQPIPYTTAASTFLYGRRSIAAALQARKRKAFNLYLLSTRNQRSNPEVAEIINVAESTNIPIKYISLSSLDALVRKTSRNAGESVDPVHDGMCLETSPYPQLPVRHLGEWNQAKHTYGLTLEPQSREDAAINGQPPHLSYHHDGWRHPFLLWLHETVDMRNVGAIMRTCVYFGVDVILSARGTANAGFHKTSAGASEYLNLLRVRDAQTFISESQKQKWRFYSAVAPGAVRNRDAPKQMVLAEDMAISPLAEGPCVLVLGNEDLGLPGSFVKMTDVGVGIGGRTKMAATAGVDSLNVGVAAALLIERFVRKPSQAEAGVLQKAKEEKLF